MYQRLLAVSQKSEKSFFFKKDFPQVKRLAVVCLEKRPRITDDGISIVSYRKFIKGIWRGPMD